jgi:hypothetical protein
LFAAHLLTTAETKEVEEQTEEEVADPSLVVEMAMQLMIRNISNPGKVTYCSIYLYHRSLQCLCMRLLLVTAQTAILYSYSFRVIAVSCVALVQLVRINRDRMLIVQDLGRACV